MTKPTISFLGAGNLACSILEGLIKNGWPLDKLIATARTEETLLNIRDKFNIKTTLDNPEAAQAGNIIMLCVKPQDIKNVLLDIKLSLQAESLIISVAAGIRMESLQLWSKNNAAIIRSMPNTPSLLKCGASGLFPNQYVNTTQKDITNRIFNSIGITKWVAEESLLDAIIAVSGSGPAYYFLMMEIVEQVGVRLGLDAQTSRDLTLQTALGAARMATESQYDTKELRRQISSPRGTTEQAIKALEENGFYELIEKAMNAAVDRSIELGKLNL